MLEEEKDGVQGGKEENLDANKWHRQPLKSRLRGPTLDG